MKMAIAVFRVLFIFGIFVLCFDKSLGLPVSDITVEIQSLHFETRSSLPESYYPDGTPATDFPYSPCSNSTPTGYSASCDFAEGDVCLLNTGLCYFPPQPAGHGNYIYRAACTDKSWTDSSCPKLCVAQNPNKFQTLSYCPSTGDFCCVKSTKGDCCQDSEVRFPLQVEDPGIMQNLKEGSNATVSDTGVQTGGSPADPSNDTKEKKKIYLGAGIGIGISLILGLLILGVLAVACYRHWKRRQSARLATQIRAGSVVVEVPVSSNRSSDSHLEQKGQFQPLLPGKHLDDNVPGSPRHGSIPPAVTSGEEENTLNIEKGQNVAGDHKELPELQGTQKYELSSKRSAAEIS